MHTAIHWFIFCLCLLIIHVIGLHFINHVFSLNVLGNRICQRILCRNKIPMFHNWLRLTHIIIDKLFKRLWWPNIPKIHKEMEPTMVLISYIGLYYLLDCDHLLQYEEGINVFYYLFYMESHMPLASVIAI